MAQDHSWPGCAFAGAPVSKALLNVLLQGGVSNTQKMLPAALDEWAVCPFHTDVSLSPLIPPLGPRRVQALPARISVSSLLSPCVAAPPCQCHPRLAPPSVPGQPGVVGERSPLAASREGPVPAESPRSSPVGVLRWQLSPSEMAASSPALPLPGGFFSPPPCLCCCLRGCVGKAIGSRAADGFICSSSICSQQLTNNHGVPEELCYLELKFLQSGRAAALRRAQPLCKGQRRHGQGLRQDWGGGQG